MKYALLILMLLCTGCSSLSRILRHEKERSVKKDVTEVLDAELNHRIEAALKTDSDIQNAMDMRTYQIFDKELPADYRGTIRLVCEHFGKLIMGLLATLAAKYGIQTEIQKRTIAKNGNGKSS